MEATQAIIYSQFLTGVGDIFVLLLRPGINRRRAQSGFRKRKIVTGRDKRPMVQRGAIMKLLSIIAAVMALVVASTTTMAEPKKPSLSNKATHRVKSPQPSTGSQHTRISSGNTTSLNAKVGTKKIRLNASGSRAVILLDLDKTMSMM